MENVPSVPEFPPEFPEFPRPRVSPSFRLSFPRVPRVSKYEKKDEAPFWYRSLLRSKERYKYSRAAAQGSTDP